MRNTAYVAGLIATLLILPTCSHIKVVAFDKRQNIVTIQGGKWASDNDFQKAADEYCQGPATLLAMDETTVGSYTAAQAHTYGNATYAQAGTRGVRRYNKTFSCDSVQESPAKSSAQPASR
jgi:hypothetical protein